MSFRELIMKRRSRRTYTKESIPQEHLKRIIEAGLFAPTGRNLHPAEVIAVRERSMLEQLSHSKTGGSALLADANAALVVVGNTECSDTWVEDCSIMMAYMQLEAEALGVGNCWVQIRSRFSQTLLADGSHLPSNDYVREVMALPDHYDVLAILALGMSDEQRPLHSVDELDWTHCHQEKF